MGDRKQGLTDIPPPCLQHIVCGPRPSRWKGYKTQFPHSNLQPSVEDPWDKAAGHEFRCQWSEKDTKFRYQRRLNDKCRREERAYQALLEDRRRKLSELLAGEKKFLEEARSKLEMGNTQRLSALKGELEAVKQRQENDHRQLVEECLMKRKSSLDDEQRRQKNRDYVRDLKAQMEMNETVLLQRALEETILSEMKSLEPWVAGHTEERGRLDPEIYRALSEGLRAEKIRYLQSKMRAREIRQKTYEDFKAYNERIMREDQEERGQLAARKARLKKEYEEQIQQRNAILRGQSREEEIAKQAYVKVDEPPEDDSFQKKVQRQKEVLGFLNYTRDFQTDQRERNRELGRLFEEEARKVMAEQQEVRNVQARTQKILREETKTALLGQIREKQVRLAGQDNQTYDPDKCFLNKLFDADDLRQACAKALQNQRNHTKQTEETKSAVKINDLQSLVNGHSHQISKVPEIDVHPKSHDW
ncbi:hypothetical protein SprV_0301155900 [Sparganum proliferum]